MTWGNNGSWGRWRQREEVSARCKSILGCTWTIRPTVRLCGSKNSWMVDGIVSRRKTISQVVAMSHELGCQGSVSLTATLLQLQRVKEEICLLLVWWDQPGHWGWDVSHWMWSWDCNHGSRTNSIKSCQEDTIINVKLLLINSRKLHSYPLLGDWLNKRDTENINEIFGWTSMGNLGKKPCDFSPKKWKPLM